MPCRGWREYWIVDPTQKKILLYSFKDSEIDKFGVYAGREVATSFVFLGLKPGSGTPLCRLAVSLKGRPGRTGIYLDAALPKLRGRIGLDGALS